MWSDSRSSLEFTWPTVYICSVLALLLYYIYWVFYFCIPCSMASIVLVIFHDSLGVSSDWLWGHLHFFMFLWQCCFLPRMTWSVETRETWSWVHVSHGCWNALVITVFRLLSRGSPFHCIPLKTLRSGMSSNFPDHQTCLRSHESTKKEREDGEMWLKLKRKPFYSMQVWVCFLKKRILGQEGFVLY